MQQGEEADPEAGVVGAVEVHRLPVQQVQTMPCIVTLLRPEAKRLRRSSQSYRSMEASHVRVPDESGSVVFHNILAQLFKQ